MTEWGVPIAVTLLGLALSWFWFSVHRRRAAEMHGGIQMLANMKWRECVGLVLESLVQAGYREAPASRQPGDGGTEFLLLNGDDKVLLSYKHGTAYRLGEANVRDFANGVQLQGADSGILVTLGNTDGAARDIARKHRVELIDGRSLWPRVRAFVPVALMAGVRQQAGAQVARGLWLGVAASFTLGLVAYLAGSALSPSAPAVPMPSASRPQATAVPRTAAAPVTPSADPTLKSIEATAQAMAAVANLSDEQRAKRRAEVARDAAKIPQVNSAAWSTQSTLVLTLARTDGKDQTLIDETCRILTQYEELRYSRLQLEPPSGSDRPVRWRQCQ